MADEVERIETLPTLSARKRDGHKGNYGRVLIVGGSRGMVGAPALAANAALRAGAGLVTVAAPQAVQLAVASLCPCATSVPLASGAGGGLAEAAVGQVQEAAEQRDVLAIGPGLGTGGGRADLLAWVLKQDRPAVIDADGLNALAAMHGWHRKRNCPLVLTPHPGEFARLTGRSVGDIQADREGAACRAAGEWAGEAAQPLVCVLKGAGTVVADGRRLYVNATGNPGMATGGTGDVLTGVIAALMGQGLGPFQAACLGVHVHGLAGDLAASRLGEVSVIASDLLEDLPAAITQVHATGGG